MPLLKPGFWVAPPVITPGRAAFALGVAVVTDALQVALGPVGWVFTVQVLDVVAMLLIVRTVGFHPLLLPTFVAELIPLVDFLPTWTGCTVAVLAMRRWAQRGPASAPGPVIDAEVVVSEPPPRPGSPPPPVPPPALPGNRGPLGD